MAGRLVTVKLFGRGSVTRRAAKFSGRSRLAVVQVVTMPCRNMTFRFGRQQPGRPNSENSEIVQILEFSEFAWLQHRRHDSENSEI
jgi:hypothetical protein